MHDALPIFRFLAQRQALGERTALVTLTGVTGSSSRAPGTHMAIGADGTAVGSFSGGCVEAAVIAEALEVLASGEARLVRFGAGSPYIDIRLPCGGGIDLLFTPDPSQEQIASACATLEQRSPLALRLSLAGDLSASPAADGEGTPWNGADFEVRHEPVLKLVVLGHGAEPEALLRVAQAYGADATMLSPDLDCVARAEDLGFPAEHLRLIGRSGRLQLDPRAAAIFLFHDHDWETDLLLESLEQAPLFIGAMGSARTHAERLKRLIERGATPDMCARIVGPVGLVPAMRDPAGLAVSIMAQVLAAAPVRPSTSDDDRLAGPVSHELSSMLHQATL